MNKEVKLSIVIPVYNNYEGLERCLEHLKNQSVSPDQYEVIVIDNGSDQVTKERMRSLCRDHVQFLEEDTYLNSPYSARNRGIEVAQAVVIAFLDTSCVPSVHWMEEGLKQVEYYPMVTGDVRFQVDENSTVGEIYDSFYNIQMRESVLGRRVAKTCNLFVRREVIDQMGMFREGVRSGEDVRWTSAAVKGGFVLQFSPAAFVTIKARKLGSLIKKQFRVAKGQPKIWKENGTVVSNFIKKILLGWLPLNPRSLQAKAKHSQIPLSSVQLISLFFLGWFLRMVNGAGNLAGFLSKNRY